MAVKSSKSKIKRAKNASADQLALLPTTETEVETYDFIRRQLRDLGWDMKNPSLGTGGQVWTQNQCLAHPNLKQSLGQTRPENIVKLTETQVWVIEAKASPGQLDKAVDEAVNFYSKKINASKGKTKAILATGVAGNDTSGYFTRTMFRIDGRWQPVTINGQVATGLLRPDDVRMLLERNEADIHEFAPPQWLFLQAAERINEILHVGGINKNDRAKTMAALLLAVLDSMPNLDSSLPILIADINTRSRHILKENGKPDFAPFVTILAPTNTSNHVKFKYALVRTIQELQNLNIRSAMNSSTDVLGQFYEVFLKYGNGAKEIGIVLTPRHITRFAVEAIGVSSQDVVLDLACGTGGFLVAAFDYVRKTCSTRQLDIFKQYNLFGIEQESYVAVLAIVNMIFRGDGKHNITEGNCFTTHITRQTVKGHPSALFTKKEVQPGEEAVTRVLMNPPFALTSSQEKEYKFVSRALSVMEDGGILFSLLPMDSMSGFYEEKGWRKNSLLPNNTLLAVISLPPELFYPAAQKQVVAIIVKKGIPHPDKQPVFWGRIARDGYLKLKSRRLHASELIPPRKEADDIPLILPLLRNFIANPSSFKCNKSMLCKTAPIDFDDPILELLPEAYIESKVPSKVEIKEAADALLRETASFMIRFKRENLAEE